MSSKFDFSSSKSQQKLSHYIFHTEKVYVDIETQQCLMEKNCFMTDIDPQLCMDGHLLDGSGI